MNDQYLADVELLVRRIEPGLDFEQLRFDLTTSADGTVHFGWCIDHDGITPARLSVAELRTVAMCSGIIEPEPLQLLSSCTEPDLGTAADVLLDLDRFDHRDPVEIRAEVTDITTATEMAFELMRFQEDVWDMFAPAMTAIPPRFAEHLQPVADSIGHRIEAVGPATIGHPEIRTVIDEYFTGVLGELDCTAVTIALAPLWLFNFELRAAEESERNTHRHAVFAAVSSYAPGIAHQRGLVTIPVWLANEVIEHGNALAISQPYLELDPVIRSTALTLWSEERDEPYYLFDRCVEAATLVNA
jgi:hypothetical protein